MENTTDQIVKQAMEFDISVITERYAAKEDIPLEVALEHEIEAKRFLILCGIKKKSYGMRGPIDEYWHEFVVFTHQYFKFCNLVSGGYIHHFPNTEKKEKRKYSLEKSDKNEYVKETDQKESIVELYLELLKDYESFYGFKPSPHLWPVPSKYELEDYTSGLTCLPCRPDSRCGGCRCHV